MKIQDLFTPLTEIRDVEIHRGRDVIDDALEFSLRQDGWYWEGTGSYSSVYSKGDYALKVFFQQETPGTRCLIRFHRMAMKMNNPHLPKVYFVKTYRGEESTRIHPPQQRVQHYIIATEKLYKLPKRTIEEELWNSLPHRSNKQERAEMLSFYAYTMDLIDQYSVAVPELARLGFGKPSQANYPMPSSVAYEVMSELSENYMKKHRKDNPLVEAYLAVLSMPQEDISCFMDMGGANTMMRGDGTIVLSDPIADDLYYSTDDDDEY